jgi:hypothetical protein
LGRGSKGTQLFETSHSFAAGWYSLIS